MPTIASQYNSLAGKQRITYLTDAIKYAKWVIPNLLPETDSLPTKTTSASVATYTPKFDSIGAEAVNFLANKLILTFFPPQRPFFRLRADSQSAIAQLALKDKNTSEKLSSVLSALEREAMLKFNSLSARADLTTAALHLLVTGNALVVYTGKQTRFYDLTKYVVERDLSGGVLTLILREGVAYSTLDKEKRDILESKKKDRKPDDIIPLYTKVLWSQDDNGYKVTQAIEDFDIPQTENVIYSRDELPYIPLAWQISAGEHYGRGMVEMYKGAFAAVNALSRELTILGLVASRIIFLVNPASSTLANRIDELNKAESGSYFIGVKDDLTTVSTDKMADAQFVSSLLAEHTQLIRRVFLMDSAVQRNAERVTAEEIRRVAQQLETSFGGVYSRLGVSWQLPMARIAINEIEPLVIDDVNFKVDIVSGVESLSRSAEVEDTLSFIQSLGIFNSVSQEVMLHLKLDTLIRKLAQGFNIDMSTYDSILRSSEEVEAIKQQMAQQQQQAAIASQPQEGTV